MAISIAETLSYAEDLAQPITTATFDTASGEVFVIIAHCDEGNDTAGITSVSLTDNQGAPLTYNLIAERGAVLPAAATAGYVGAWWFTAGSITGLTVTLTFNGNSGTGDCAVRVLKVTGNVSTTAPVGASTSNAWTTDPQTTASITPQTSGIGICAASDWNAASHTTTSSDLTISSFALSSGNLDMCSGYKTLSAGVGATANLNAAATPAGNYIWFEIRDEGGGGATPSAALSTMTMLGVQ